MMNCAEKNATWKLGIPCSEDYYAKMSNDTVLACPRPKCDSTSLNQAAGDNYRCTTCGNKFSTPIERERQNKTKAGNKGAAKTLADAKPEDWP